MSPESEKAFKATERATKRGTRANHYAAHRAHVSASTVAYTQLGGDSKEYRDHQSRAHFHFQNSIR
mgnify:FL=1